ncbi:unnamed protein product [Rotaria socialis]|uniref:Uncharacterized protein n=1 Tax=Rotaria socialis TaxID=392032 RepID=A0A821RCP2_9BILA|nr:unnamed protein product [Rotaria socialis]CAF4839573.1 unnamed protein product [Rotaria socialis]
MGTAECCCDRCNYSSWGQFCNGDLAGNQGCASNQILGFGIAQTFQSKPVPTGPICYWPGRCYLQTWRYVYECCTCPTGYKLLTSGSSKPNCMSGARCQGCTYANEVLVGEDDSKGYECKACPSGKNHNMCKPAKDNCDFYKCLESNYECGPTGYPTSFGLKYCQKYAEESSNFTPQGQKWITLVRLCLQESLINDAVCKTNCSTIHNNAFKSHARCYISSGVCKLPSSDWNAIKKTVGIATLLASKDAFLEALKTKIVCNNLFQAVLSLILLRKEQRS